MQRIDVTARSRRLRAPVVLLWVAICAYALFFSAFTIQRHATLNTYAADLSYIDQPMWNTMHGRFLERTLGAVQAPRVAEHLELILLPLSLVYLVWPDVRAMLILQSLALAIGALPVFWIARRTFRGLTAAGQEGVGRDGVRAEWLALAFSVAYLLSAPLQAANVADFHADPFVVAPLLFAFWYGTERRWRAMWLWALLVMAAKENLPTLTAMLGLVLIFSDPDLKAFLRRRPLRVKPDHTALRSPALHGLALILVSVAWFGIATFAIVAPLARQYYGTDGPIYLSNRFTEFGGSGGSPLAALFSVLREPGRLDYLLCLLRSVGWLPLLAPEYLLLGLPVLLANVLSNFPGQFSGEQHYSAPLVPVLVIAAIYGARRLQRIVERQVPVRLSPMFTNTSAVAVLGAVWLLLWAGGAQVERGWTPLARPFEWPELTAHHRTLDRLLAQIPGDAAVSASPAVHAHLAHREKIYVFPVVAQATHVLIDVAGVTDMHPNDVKTQVERLIGEEGFGVMDAADGFILLARGETNQVLPPDFLTFVRPDDPQPDIPAEVRFGPGLRLLGYDVVDDERWRLTRFRYYWQVEQGLADDVAIQTEVRSAAGVLVDSSDLRPAAGLVWHPPGRWVAGEVIAFETGAWFLPRQFAPVVRVTSGGRTVTPSILAQPAAASRPAADSRPAAVEQPAGMPARAEVAADGALRLPSMVRREGRVSLYEGALSPVVAADVVFSTDAWQVRLAEWSAPPAAAPGSAFTLLLYWQGSGSAPFDYSVFVHLRDVTGKTVSQGDAQPTWFVPRPATTWQPVGDGTTGGIDAHSVAVPADLPHGQYDLVVGWYDWSTGLRLPRVAGPGNPPGDEVVLGAVTVDPTARPRPDACCLMVAECCASLER
jgi:uncharacterized membrane protein